VDADATSAGQRQKRKQACARTALDAYAYTLRHVRTSGQSWTLLSSWK
jgi:hypothetical protein